MGWELLADSGHDPAHALLGLPRLLPLPQWLGLAGGSFPQRKWIMLLEVPDSTERARMLRMGFGDALDFGASLEELEYRVLRLTHFAQSLPRYRYVGALKIDLLARDASVAGRALGLHPHELLTDVWRLTFRPETNSLAVHVSRLRAKLRLAGIDGLIDTLPDGAYRLAPPQRGAIGGNPDLGLDGYLRIGKEYVIAASRI